MVERSFTTKVVCLAGRLRGIYHRDFSGEGHGSLHQHARTTPRQNQLCRRMVANSEPSRYRRFQPIKLSAVPAGTGFCFVRLPAVETAVYFLFVPRSGTGLGTLIACGMPLAVLRLFVSLLLRQILEHLGIGNGSRDNVTTAGPLSEIDQPASVAAEGKVLVTGRHDRAAGGAAQ